MLTLASLANFFEFDLVAHRLDGLRARPDEDDAFGIERLAERGAFREKAIAGMNRLCARLPAGRDDLFYDEIAFRSGSRADMHGLVCHLHVQGAGIGVRIDRDGGDAHPARGLHDAAGDLAAVGNQYLLEHAVALPGVFPPLSHIFPGRTT